MIVRLLGPVEVAGPRGRAVLSGRQRALVGVLALQTGTVVVPARVVDALWGENPPRTAVKSLHSHVARVRQALCACGLTDVLLTRSSGYTLAVERDEVDVCRFEDQVRSAREQLAAGRWAPAAQHLREGLALCSGDPVQDAELAGWGAAEVIRLKELRLTALEDLCDAELRLGHAAAAAAELERFVVRHPLRERLVELLMLALYRTGRPLDALEAYQRLRTRLAHELGVDPAPDLQRLHTAVLRHDPELAASPAADGRVEVTAPADALVARPAQLPPRVGHFTGRTGELQALDRVLDGPGDTHIAVISGRGGMGKTALAVQWAHQVKDRYPDGQLFLDLRGRDIEAAMTATEALTQVLRSLGVPGDKMPADLPELTSLFRSVLADKRVLILLDNGATADQVRPLVPPTTASALVVTCRRPMTALATYHAVGALSLEALGAADALALLCSVVGGARVDQEPDSAARIVDWCGRMPLALRIAAARLASQPNRPLADLVAELAGENGLDALSVEGDTRSVRTLFASAYRTLSAPAARMFRRLGLHPGTTFVRELAAAVAGLPPAAADATLAELVDAYLVVETGDPAGGRYRFHDLIQLFAAECARREETAAGRAETVERLLDWYLGVADAANRALDRGRDRVVPELRHPPSRVPFAANHQDALAFLDGERENLTPLVRFAGEQGRPSAAWQLTYLLTGYFDSRGRWADRVEVCRLGLAAAQRQRDPVAEALMLSALGVAYLFTRQFDRALDSLFRALELTRTSGDRRREGHVANSIATAYAGLRRYDEALEAHLQALVVHRSIDDRLGIAMALNNIGTTHIRLGQPELSFPHLVPALRLIREVDNPRIEAWILSTLGEAHLKAGCFDEAMERFTQALRIRRAIGDRRSEVDTLNNIGLTRLGQADHAAAAGRFQDALALSRELADPHLVSVCLTHLATAQIRRGELDAARGGLRRALVLRTRVPDPYEEANIHRALTELALRAGQPDAADEHRERAVRLFQKASAPAEAAELAAAVSASP